LRFQTSFIVFLKEGKTIKFSKLMRLILENSRHKEVLLEKDLEALRLYMELESARMNHKFLSTRGLASNSCTLLLKGSQTDPGQ